MDCYDPWVDPKEAVEEFNIKPIEHLKKGTYDAVVIAVAHQQFVEMGAEAIIALCKKENIIYDLKYVLSTEDSDLRL